MYRNRLLTGGHPQIETSFCCITCHFTWKMTLAKPPMRDQSGCLSQIPSSPDNKIISFNNTSLWTRKWLMRMTLKYLEIFQENNFAECFSKTTPKNQNKGHWHFCHKKKTSILIKYCVIDLHVRTGG